MMFLTSLLLNHEPPTEIWHTFKMGTWCHAWASLCNAWGINFKSVDETRPLFCSALVATKMQRKKICNGLKKCSFLRIDMELPHVLLTTEVYLFSGKCSPRNIFCFSTHWGSFFSSVQKLVDMDVGIIDRPYYWSTSV